MSYAITNAKGLASIGHPTTSRLGGIAGDTSPVTVDGTTTGEREMMIAAVSMQIAEWQSQVNKALAGDLSITGTLGRGLLFIPSAYQNRQFMQKAKTDLAALMTDIAARLRNYQQPTAPVMEYAIGMLDNIAGQIGAALSSAAKATLRGFAREVKKNTVNNANALLTAAREAGEGATDGVFPVWVGPVAGVFLVAYLWNTFRVR